MSSRYADLFMSLSAPSDEVFREVPGHPGYRASNFGRVQSRMKPSRTGSMYDEWRDLKMIPRAKGYIRVNFHGRLYGVHQVVMMTFVGPCPEGMEVLHGDGCSHNNRLENLRYGTRLDNIQDAMRHGTIASGEAHWNAKLSDPEVEEIRRLYSNGCRVCWLAQTFGVNHQTVSKIVRLERRRTVVS